MLRQTLCWVLLLMWAGFAEAAEPKGARSVLDGVQRAAKRDPKPEEGAGQTAAAKFAADLKAYRTAAAGLAPEEAARQWLALLDRLPKARAGAEAGGGRFGRFDGGAGSSASFAALVGALPPPQHWPALIKAIEARPAGEGPAAIRQLALRVLAAAMTGNHDKTKAAVESYVKSFAGGEGETSFYLLNELEPLLSLVGQRVDEKTAVRRQLEQEIAEAASGNGGGYLRVANLVKTFGSAEAEKYLRQALVLPFRQIELGDVETQKLAQKLTLELIDKIPLPRWDVVSGIDKDTIALYEALDKRFVKEKRKDAPPADAADPADNAEPAAIRALLAKHGLRHRGEDTWAANAKLHYFAALVAAGRLDEAAVLARSSALWKGGYHSNDAAEALTQAGHAAALADLLHKVLTDDPNLDCWQVYFRAAAAAQKTDQAIDLARKSVAKSRLVQSKRLNILVRLHAMQLAADRVDEGAASLRDAVKLSLNPDFDFDERGDETPHSLGLKLAALGKVLKRPALIEEGLAAAMEGAREAAHQRFGSYAASEVVELLMDLGRFDQAEAILAEQLAAQQPSREENSFHHFESGQAQSRTLADLARLYHRAGRHQDVLLLFNEAEYWQAPDLAALLGDNGLGLYGKPSLGHIAAKALAAAGRKAEALRVLDFIFSENSRSDEDYALLIEIEGQGAMARLDAIFANDPFEERPLIWKAHLLIEAGKAAEALAVIQRAIAIDPSDGEQGKGDRMRAYAVLARIHEKQGDAEKAKFFQGVVQAIRMAEDADDLLAAGLTKRGLESYSRSLQVFADAYCIQSRLAVQLSRAGRHEEAAEHYRKAYELMPDSFGRMESHCFGCEGVFSEAAAQKIAERVFLRLIENRPMVAQLHYLMGYLREQQGREAEALKSYQKAVELDPDYLNAWQKIERLASMSQKDQATLKLLHLDPRQRHSRGDLAGVLDLPALWRAVEAAQKRQTQPVKSLLELTAAKHKLSTAKGDPAPLRDGFDFPGLRHSEDAVIAAGPGTVLSQHVIVRAVSPLFDGQ